MPNGGLIIYREFIDAMSLLASACMVTGCYLAMSQLAAAAPEIPTNMISVRFNTGVTRRA